MSDETQDKTTWTDLESFLGAPVVAIIDKAIGEFLADCPDVLRREDYYLVSEGLTYSVVAALRAAQIAVTPGLRAVR